MTLLFHEVSFSVEIQPSSDSERIGNRTLWQVTDANGDVVMSFVEVGELRHERVQHAIIAAYNKGHADGERAREASIRKQIKDAVTGILNGKRIKWEDVK